MLESLAVARQEPPRLKNCSLSLAELSKAFALVLTRDDRMLSTSVSNKNGHRVGQSSLSVGQKNRLVVLMVVCIFFREGTKMKLHTEFGPDLE
jgi:hypothetical protein